MQQPLTINNTYQIVEQIGQGSFGVIYKAIDTSENNKEVAIKVQSYQRINKSEALYKQFKREIFALQNIKNDNVVKLIEQFNINKNDVCIVLEYCNQKDIAHYLNQQEQGYISEQEAIQLFKQILNAFKGLREQSIIHRDIKLENIFLHNGQVKLGDFGLCRQLDEEIQRAGTFLGTYTTMAPEVLNKDNYNSKADIYSLGVILFQMVYGKQPYSANSRFELMKKQQQMDIEFNNKEIKVSEQLQDLLKKMLQYDADVRINWQDIYNHPSLGGDLKVSAIEEIQDDENELLGLELKLEKSESNSSVKFQNFQQFQEVLIKQKKINDLSEDIGEDIMLIFY